MHLRRRGGAYSCGLWESPSSCRLQSSLHEGLGKEISFRLLQGFGRRSQGRSQERQSEGTQAEEACSESAREEEKKGTPGGPSRGGSRKAEEKGKEEERRWKPFDKGSASRKTGSLQGKGGWWWSWEERRQRREESEERKETTCQRCRRRGVLQCRHRGRLLLCGGKWPCEAGEWHEAGTSPCFGTPQPSRGDGGEARWSEEESSLRRDETRSPAAGDCRAAERASGKHEEKRQEGRERPWKGKGVGETKEKEEGQEEEEKEQKEKKEKEEEEGLRWEQRRILELYVNERKKREKQLVDEVREQQRLEPFSSVATEVQAESWRSTSNVDQACPSADGPRHSGGRGGRCRHLGRSPDDQLLQPHAPPLLPHVEQGYERTIPAGNDDRSTTAGKTWSVGRRYGQPFHCDTNSNERGQLEVCSILRDAPVGQRDTSSSLPAFGSEETRKVDRQEPEAGGIQRKRKLEGPREGEVAVRRCSERKKLQRKTRKRKRPWPWSMGTARWWMGSVRSKPQLVGDQKRGAREASERRRRKGRGREKEVRYEPGSAGNFSRAGSRERLKPGLEELQWVLESATCLRRLGVALAWLMAMSAYGDGSDGTVTPLVMVLLGWVAGNGAVQRASSRSSFPLPLGGLEVVISKLLTASREGVLDGSFVQEWSDDAWLLLSVVFLNRLHGCRALVKDSWRKVHRGAIQSLKLATQRALAQDSEMPRTVSQVEKELSGRFLSYSGEEVPRMEVLTVSQVLPALPPQGHGGCIPAVSWVGGRTSIFLRNPWDCVLSDAEVPTNFKLKAKVHVVDSDKLALAELLVNRGVCTWTREDSVFRFRGEMVLNGLFGVAKSATIPSGEAVLRVIMNLIPTNGVLCQLKGLVSELPGICQYMSIYLGPGEELKISQSDMTSAFYLFALPEEWAPYLTFNLGFPGHMIGKGDGGQYFLSCRVLPMGWSSAVGVMQELSSNLLRWGGLPTSQQVCRNKPLPPWLVEALVESQEKGQGWWHIYLDNFFSAEKVAWNDVGEEGKRLHDATERIWNDTGVLSSKKKLVSSAGDAEELGGKFSSESKYLGVSGERLVKVSQTTLLVVGRRFLPKKWLQVVCGRWVHILQFRRAGMVALHDVWQIIAGKQKKNKDISTRGELMSLIQGACLFHTFLGAKQSVRATASDASGKGGAIGTSEQLTQEGSDVCRALSSREELINVDLLVVSLFNGIGGAFRIYDILGVRCTGLLGYDIHKPANRVCSRRWPQAVLETDVKKITKQTIRKWLFDFPHLTEIHVWGGFPCVDLSAVKFKRQNLQGSQSSLFFVMVDVIKMIREVFGINFKIYYFFENVASMDLTALMEISSHLGVKPYRVQSSDSVPMSRPRLCWTDCPLPRLPGVKLTDKGHYVLMELYNDYPNVEQWIRPDSCWEGAATGVVLPTCMKSIPRVHPPPAPAGLQRADIATILRWEADQMRYPPYQYKEEYLLWASDRWRLSEASERELLHGFGFGHTEVCMSASDIKRGVQAYEDERCSLVGDSFNVFSFVVFGWAALFEYLPKFNYAHLCNRMGLAPGYAAPVHRLAPMARRLQYGFPKGEFCSVGALSSCFLAPS